MNQDVRESPVRKDSLLPTSRNRKAKKLNPAERVIAIKRMEQDLEVLQPTPLKPIKAAEIWKKWGSLLLTYARLITYQEPSNGIIDSIQNRKRNNTRERTKRKTGKETATSNKTSLINDADTVMSVEKLKIAALDNDEEAVMPVSI